AIPLTHSLSTLSLHDALPISVARAGFNCFDGALCDGFGVAPRVCSFACLPDLFAVARRVFEGGVFADVTDRARAAFPEAILWDLDRKSTRLNSSHLVISYAVF